ncbi:MAG: hypothetical protein Q8R02_23530, partial [Hyphomonadaceae bacterium]|nr:hypothetical protein [Hyphomonadaceae bacterium]
EAESTAAGTVETRAEFNEEFVKNWLTAIEMAGKEEEPWRTDAKNTLERYRSEKNRGKNYNILYANTQTTCPALYNSEPTPDVRRRFAADDESGETLATMLERALSIQGELYDLDACLKGAVKDRQIQGRGVTRVRLVKGDAGSSHVECEHVSWDDFRRGPAKTWKDVPWTAIRWKYTREELIALSPKIGKEVTLDCVVGDAPTDKDGQNLPDMFKRATVWEIWDRQERKVYFIAESYKDAPIATTPDPYKLRDFFPVPRPLYAVETTDSLIPVCEFMIWKPLADEVDQITARISGIIKVMKLRGLYDGALEDAVKKMATLEDGQLAPAADAARVMQQGAIDKSVWLWPVDKAIDVVKGLYEAREQAKQTIYEITGVADILRGSTNPNETLGAQQLKAQWGSLRLQEAQREVQRYARDLYRMMADLMSELMEPAELVAMTGIQIDANAAALLKKDLQREFAIEIETDSTIRADLARSQENVAGFVTGFGTFIQAVGPAVEAGYMPAESAVGLLQAFARNFKLGREAETIMDEWKKMLEEKAQQPPPPPPPDPKLEAEKAKAEAAKAGAAAKMQQTQMQGEIAQADHQMTMQERQAEFSMKMAMLKAEFEVMQQEHALDMQTKQADAAIRVGEHQLATDEQQRSHEMGRESHTQGMEAIAAKAAAQKAAAKGKTNGARK